MRGAGVGEVLGALVQGSEMTEREMDVLRLLAKGFSNRSISDALSIAENTTRIHVGRILDKLGVEDRTQAVILAIQRGLVHVD